MDDDDDSEAPSEPPVTPALPELPPVDPEVKARDFSQVDLSFTTYVMRRISCSARATYIVFWVQDKKDESYIAVVVRYCYFGPVKRYCLTFYFYLFALVFEAKVMNVCFLNDSLCCCPSFDLAP